MDNLANTASTMPMMPRRLLNYLKAPGASDDTALERDEGGFRDSKTGSYFPDRNGVPSLLAGIDTSGSDKVTSKIKAFYEEHPFPNYDGVEAYGDLVRRGETSAFYTGLLSAIGYNKLVLECGCGTGQLSHFLTLNNNHALGIDLSTASLSLAVEHKIRNKIERVGFVQMNIFELAIKDESFDVVISSGVLHHTKDARRAFALIVKKAKPGGIVVVGLYNWFARAPTWVRSKLVDVVGYKVDYVVRNRIRDSRKAEIWIKDQYYNPHETWHSIDEVIDWFRENDIEYLNCYPPILGNESAGMFDKTSSGSRMTRFLTQLSWLATISVEGALFELIGRKRR
jgi:2-polyprenyl-3-methyl-5-hydroxy-6-metoxy-1,4-benzoquinol methylase